MAKLTARDICSNCGHTWDDHDKAETDPFWAGTSDTCGCCFRVAKRVKELNAGQPPGLADG